jgi:hypothetical protein
MTSMASGHGGGLRLVGIRMRPKHRAIGSVMPLSMPYEDGVSRHPTAQENAMTSNRMEAQPSAGEHGRFCGDATAPLVKTPYCEQWMCCDTALLSFRGGTVPRRA